MPSSTYPSLDRVLWWREEKKSCIEHLHFRYRKATHAQDEDEEEDEGAEVGGLFRVVREKEVARAEHHQLADGTDCSLFR